MRGRRRTRWAWVRRGGRPANIASDSGEPHRVSVQARAIDVIGRVSERDPRALTALRAGHERALHAECRAWTRPRWIEQASEAALDGTRPASGVDQAGQTQFARAPAPPAHSCRPRAGPARPSRPGRPAGVEPPRPFQVDCRGSGSSPTRPRCWAAGSGRPTRIARSATGSPTGRRRGPGRRGDRPGARGEQPRELLLGLHAVRADGRQRLQPGGAGARAIVSRRSCTPA